MKRRKSFRSRSMRLKSKSKIRRTSRSNLKKDKIYTTLDNGGAPFTVKVSSQKVKIYKNILRDDDYSWKKVGEKLVLTLKNPKKIFVGSDPPGFYYNKTSRPREVGNSLLVNTVGNKYVYIGESVKQFIANDTIKKYLSPVGNSAVPYPFAVGEKYTYLMIEGKKMLNTDVDNKPYEEFYDDKKIAKNLPMKILIKRT